ncbi:MAG TPA: hypothetical protein VKR61_09615 [Bryobacteraceae bacterium]|nr:hypothetical protein [Bryobacteraceae bacterium]
MTWAADGLLSVTVQVKMLVDQVGAGREEQSVGLEQISKAITLMERSGQTTAAGSCAALVTANAAVAVA